MASENLFSDLNALFEAIRDLLEMPHVSFDADVGALHLGTVDFQIEKYPMSPAEKTALMKAIRSTGVIAKSKNGWLHFDADGKVGRASEAQRKTLPRLPDYWEKYLLNVE